MSVWWFSVNENNVLLFKTRDVSREVISVKPDDCTVLITAADKDTIFNTKASVVNYLTVDPGFPLEDRTSAEVFLATLDGLMRGKSVSFFIPADGGDVEISEKKKKKKYVCQLPFKEQIELMRGLHPDRDNEDPCQELDAGVKPWRRSCAAALKLPEHFEPVDFGGHFKEAIRVSTFSQRNYLMAQHIIDQSQGEKAIFRESCGFKDEALLHQLLREMADDKMKKSEFNKTLKELKTQQNPRDSIDGDTSVRQQLKTSQARVKALEKELEELKTENSLLRTQLLESRQEEKSKGENQPRDVYDFVPDEEGDRQSDEGRQPITVEVWEPVEMARDETTLSDEDEALPAAQTRENRELKRHACYSRDSLRVKLPRKARKRLSENEIHDILSDSEDHDDDCVDPNWDEKSKQKDQSFSSEYGSDDNDDDDALDQLNRGFLKASSKGTRTVAELKGRKPPLKQAIAKKPSDVKMGFFKPTQTWLPVTIRGKKGNIHQVTFMTSGVRTVLSKNGVREPTKLEIIQFKL